MFDIFSERIFIIFHSRFDGCKVRFYSLIKIISGSGRSFISPVDRYTHILYPLHRITHFFAAHLANTML